MTTYTNTADGGTNGTTATTANTGGGSGTAVSAIYGTAPTFTTATAADGVASYAVQAASGAVSALEWSGLTGTDFAARFSIRISGNPSATTEILQLRDSTLTGSLAVRLLLTTTGRLQLNRYDNSTYVWLATNSLDLNTWYDIAVEAKAGASSTTGTLRAAYYYNATPSTAVESFTSTTTDAGTAAKTAARVGKLTTTAWASTFWIDSITITDAAANTLPAPLSVTSGSPKISKISGDRWFVDLATGTTASAGGALSYGTPTLVSGPALTFFQVATGKWVFQRDSTDSVYSFTVSEASAGTSSTQETIPALGTGTGGGLVSKRLVGGTWTTL